MSRKSAWEEFEKTGKIESYLNLYISLFLFTL